MSKYILSLLKLSKKSNLWIQWQGGSDFISKKTKRTESCITPKRFFPLIGENNEGVMVRHVGHAFYVLVVD